MGPVNLLTRLSCLPLDVAADGRTLLFGNWLAHQGRIDGGAKILASDWDAIARTACVELAPIHKTEIGIEEI